MIAGSPAPENTRVSVTVPKEERSDASSGLRPTDKDSKIPAVGRLRCG
jgi:hypothetical protein